MSKWFRMDNVAKSGVMTNLTSSLNTGFSLSQSAIVGENE